MIPEKIGKNREVEGCNPLTIVVFFLALNLPKRKMMISLSGFFKVAMLRTAANSTLLRIFLLAYLLLMLVFYPVSRMYANEYETVPIKFEFAFFMVLVGLFSNAGILFVLSGWGLRHKKTTYATLIVSAFMNAFLLLITNGNPFSFIANEDWNTFRFLSIYAVLAVGGLLCACVRGCRRES